MNNLIQKIKENFFPFVIAVILLGGSCTAWYMFHPASPHHKRYSFVVSYDAIGTLSPGNRVEVRGISKGEITKVELTDDAVFVTARVLADTKIPVNSEFRLINAGLMGEREMCVLTGDATEYISEGDTLIGHYDEGTSGVFKSLETALNTWLDIKQSLVALKDTISDGSIGKTTERVLKKGDRLIGTSKSLIASMKSDLNGTLDRCDALLNNAKELLTKVSGQADDTEGKVKELVDRIDALLNHVGETKNEFNAVLAKLDQDDNTAGLVLAKDGVFMKKLDALSADIDALITDIKKNGAKLNVDIF